MDRYIIGYQAQQYDSSVLLDGFSCWEDQFKRQGRESSPRSDSVLMDEADKVTKVRYLRQFK
jgi:hypothetical protein